MIPSELKEKIRRIQITTNRIVDETIAGQYQSAFKGRGMEFSEVREYLPGDDIRSIDWNVTARFNKPYVKNYVEERELTVLLLIDISGSQGFGSTGAIKNELAAEISAILAFSAIKNNDQVGCILFSDHIDNYIPPKKGSKHVLRVIRDILYTKSSERKTDIANVLEYLGKVQKRRAVVFLVSDFFDSGYEKTLRIINKHHDLVSIIVEDRREYVLPASGYSILEDSETGESAIINWSNSKARNAMLDKFAKAAEYRDHLFASAGIDCFKVRTGEPYEATLYRFFKSRARRMR
ncbi:DUF58 domain-containing protein [bacterium]|nr:DUF58 domain-containing protein [candidate division CSSED10-310 bacterium]